MNNPNLNNNVAAQQQARQPHNARPPYSPNAISPAGYPPGGIPNLSGHPYSNSQYSQQHPPKRVRLSPEADSPQPTSRSPQLPSPHSAGPQNGGFVNGIPGPPPPGSMGPPSRPPDRTEERDVDSVLAGTGINLEEEDRRLTITATDFYGGGRNNSFQSPRTGVGGMGTDFYGQPNSASARDGLTNYDTGDLSSQTPLPDMTPEEMQRRREAQADWEAARHSQYPTWDMFLYGEELQKRVTRQCLNEHLKSHEAGLMRPSRHHDPQPTRVDGRGGASRVINQGQTILSMDSGKELRSILDLLCLASKERLTGIMDLSARLARERQEHSKGKIPAEWASMAVAAPAAVDVADDSASPGANPAYKRPYSEAFADAQDNPPGQHRVTEIFQRISQTDRAAEVARLAKRAKRNATSNADAGQTTASGAETPAVPPVEPEKRVTKKDRKLAETRFTEQQQHKSANETARLATAGMLGRLGGKQKKSYSWLQGGASAASTPTKPAPGSASTSAAATPSGEKAGVPSKEKVVGQWDEDNDPGIQVRDVLLVLENDGRAAKSVVRGYSKPEG